MRSRTPLGGQARGNQDVLPVLFQTQYWSYTKTHLSLMGQVYLGSIVSAGMAKPCSRMGPFAWRLTVGAGERPAPCACLACLDLDQSFVLFASYAGFMGVVSALPVETACDTKRTPRVGLFVIQARTVLGQPADLCQRQISRFPSPLRQLASWPLSKRPSLVWTELLASTAGGLSRRRAERSARPPLQMLSQSPGNAQTIHFQLREA
ncbi:MAG: hypothetical protein RLZZ117_64 [Cyanobacteriota bacterium]